MVIIQTYSIAGILLSNLTEECTTNCGNYTINIRSNGDTIQFNRNLNPIPIPCRDIFIHKLGQDMLATVENNATVNITYCGIDYLIHLGYIIKSKELNILECTRLGTDIVFRFKLTPLDNNSTCYTLIKML